MPNIREEKPKSLPEYLEIIERMQVTANHGLWYRGCGKNSYCLIPSLYRHKKVKKPDQLGKLEHV